jgi:hypothetical protein
MSAKSIAEKLPGIDDLKKLCQSLAMLEAILSPVWDYRYYSFNSKWAEAEMMASMRNGSGDGYFILFTAQGAAIKGFAHEAPMSPWNDEEEQIWPGVLDQVPDEFAGFLAELAFSMDDTTFCLWRRYTDTKWLTGNIKYPADEDPDGAEELLGILTGTASTYQAFVRDYYETELPLAAIEQLYEHRHLTNEIVAMLNPEIQLKDITEDIDEIAYPRSSAS